MSQAKRNRIKGCLYFLLSVSCLIWPFSCAATGQALSILDGVQDWDTSSDELLFVQRIMQFWKDNDNTMAIHQINEFFQSHPQSKYKESLLIVLGNLYSDQQKFEEALDCYKQIQSVELKNKSAASRFNARLHLKQFKKLTKDTLSVLAECHEKILKNSAHFYFGQAQLGLAKLNQNDRDLAEGHYLKAEEAFKDISEGEYTNCALQNLAEVYECLGQHENKCKCYDRLLQECPDDNERILFLVAQAQKRYNPVLSLETYRKVRDLNGDHCSQANCELLALLFEQGAHQQIVNEILTFKHYNLANNRYVPLLIGRAHSCLNNHEEAINYLNPLLNDFRDLTIETVPEDDKNFIKSLLMPLIYSGYGLNELAMVEHSVKDYERLLGKTGDYGEVLFVLALTYKNCDHYGRAEQVINELLISYPTFEKASQATLERALAQFKQQKWEISRSSFLQFLDAFPSSPYVKEVPQYIASATQSLLDEAEKNKQPLKLIQEQLVFDLQRALSLNDTTMNAQRPLILIKMGELFFALNRPSEAIECLKDFPLNYAGDPYLYRAHLLLAACYEKTKEFKSYVTHAEEVLKLKNDIPEKKQLLLNLFVSYAKMAENALKGSQEQQAYLELAAENLYTAFELGSPLEKNHLKWLGNFYYQKVTLEPKDLFYLVLNTELEKVNAERALKLLESLTNDQEPSVTIALENEILKLSLLYAALNKKDAHSTLLQRLTATQLANPTLSWKWTSRACFLLGNYYLDTSQNAEALTLFVQASNLPKTDVSAFGFSKIAVAKLTLHSLDSEQQSLDNPQVVSLLKSLKDLQMAKIWSQEPLHLTAAIEYAKLRASLVPSEEGHEQLRGLLVRVKQDFSEEQDIPSKEYHRLRRQDSKKDLLYQTYLKTLDGLILLQEAKMASLKKLPEETFAKKEQAVNLLKEIQVGNLSYAKELSNQIDTALKEIETL